MFSFFSDKIIDINQKDIIKEGFLKKESRIRKVWRDRWVVLTKSHLYTFENRNIYKNPTETIEVKNIRSVKTDQTKGQRFVFVSHKSCNNIKLQTIKTEEIDFYFEANNFEEKEQWIGAIGGAMVQPSSYIPGNL